MKKICERCGNFFICLGNEENQNNCWCKDLKLSKKTIEKASKNCCDCLCENCLVDLNREKL